MGYLNSKLGGSVAISRDLNENTASTAPAAPNKWPIADLFELGNGIFVNWK